METKKKNALNPTLLTPTQNIQNYRWAEDEVSKRLDAAMVAAFKRTWDTAQEKGVTLRTAAFIVALESVTRATMNRGFD